MIIVDTKEPPAIFKRIKKIHEDTQYLNIPIGDIVCPEKGICIERKTLADYISSTKSGHLNKQVIQMQNSFDYPYIIISGSLGSLRFMKHVRWSIEHHLGSLASLMARSKIRILMVDNDTQLCNLAVKIIGKTFDGKQLTIRDTELLRNNLTTDDLRVKILTCFTGIGIKKAEKLLEKPEIVEKVNALIEVMK